MFVVVFARFKRPFSWPLEDGLASPLSLSLGMCGCGELWAMIGFLLRIRRRRSLLRFMQVYRSPPREPETYKTLEKVWKLAEIHWIYEKLSCYIQKQIKCPPFTYNQSTPANPIQPSSKDLCQLVHFSHLNSLILLLQSYPKKGTLVGNRRIMRSNISLV